jgi:hypothetical protein
MWHHSLRLVEATLLLSSTMLEISSGALPHLYREYIGDVYWLAR